MTDKQTNLHPKNDSSVNLKPNIITPNIPDKAVTLEKLDQNLQETIRSHTADIESNTADIKSNTVDIETNMRDINTITGEIENLKASVNTGTFNPVSNDPASQKSIAGAMASKDVAENKNVLIRLECREDGLYVVGTDI